MVLFTKATVEPNHHPLIWRQSIKLRRTRYVNLLYRNRNSYLATHLHTPLMAVNNDHNDSFATVGLD